MKEHFLKNKIVQITQRFKGAKESAKNDMVKARTLRRVECLILEEFDRVSAEYHSYMLGFIHQTLSDNIK